MHNYNNKIGCYLQDCENCKTYGLKNNSICDVYKRKNNIFSYKLIIIFFSFELGLFVIYLELTYI